MKFRFLKPCLAPTVVLLLFSCSVIELANNDAPETRIPSSLPPPRTSPDLRIQDYKNREAGAVLAPWLRSYLNNGIAAAESINAYRNSYLFIAQIRSTNVQVVNQWIRNFSPDRDFSRLAADRIRARLERDLSLSPDEYYGPYYEKTVKAAYQTSFWGARRQDDCWVLGTELHIAGGTPVYWGFILLSIPRDTLEIQINELLKGIEDSGKKAVKDQDSAFEDMRDHFFEQF
jgi:hypothetical protein